MLEVLKSAGSLPKGEGPIVKVIDNISRFEDQFIFVLKGVSLACTAYGK